MFSWLQAVVALICKPQIQQMAVGFNERFMEEGLYFEGKLSREEYLEAYYRWVATEQPVVKPETTPVERFAELLSKVTPSAAAWYELNNVLTDYMKVRSVQVTEVSDFEVISRLKALYPRALFHRQRDNKYRLCSKAKGQEIIERDWTNLVTYVSEFVDCDKFVTVFQAHLALHYGLNNWFATWSKPHAFFTVLYTDGEAIFEPQNDGSLEPVNIPNPTYQVSDVYP